MLIGDFKAKLQKLNPQLWVNTDKVTKMEGLRHAGIYLKNKKQSGLSEFSKGYASAAQEKYCLALQSGDLDQYLCGICVEFIPEYDIFNKEYSKISIPGWRSILMRLIQQKAITKDKAQKVFDCSSLGENDYDRMSFFQKMQFAKKVDENA